MTVFLRRGELSAAEAAGRETEKLYRQVNMSVTGPRFGEFRIELGDVLIRLGRSEEAERQWREVLTLRDGLPLLPEHAEVQLRLAWLSAAEDEVEKAQRLALDAWQIFDRHGQLARNQKTDELLVTIESRATLPPFDELFGF